jgi:hypothetical protein
MNRKVIIATLIVFGISAYFSVAHPVQKEMKPWTEWTLKDAEKMLKESPWAKLQVETDTSEMFYSPTSDPRMTRNAPNANARLEEGATNQEMSIKYGIRFFSARPIRQAFARSIELQQKLDSESTARLHQFAEIESPLSIIVAVTFESTDRRTLGKAMQAFNSAGAGTLKNKAYLERSDGKRVFLTEYVPPGKDGFGARFIFLRNVDERPFLTSDAGEVRFFAELTDKMKLNMRFKVADMMLNGKLEY